MSSRDQLYTGAAYKLKARKVTTSSTDPLRYVLDDVYNQTLTYMLEAGDWNFATRTVAIEFDDNVDAAFGYFNAFEVPEDFVRLVAISASSAMFPPFAAGEFAYERSGDPVAWYWSANVTILYVSYVSNDTDYGLDLSTWTETFATAFEYELAVRAGPNLTNMDNQEFELLCKRRDRALSNARTKDARNQTLQALSPGILQRSRMGAIGWLKRG